ncbi:Uncharacterised protein at_DN0212 [Pycnogonum litorale]
MTNDTMFGRTWWWWLHQEERLVIRFLIGSGLVPQQLCHGVLWPIISARELLSKGACVHADILFCVCPVSGFMASGFYFCRVVHAKCITEILCNCNWLCDIQGRVIMCKISRNISDLIGSLKISSHSTDNY